MYVSPTIVQLLHEERVREAQRNASSRRIYELSEPMPEVIETGLLSRIKLFKRANSQPQEVADVRRAHATI